MRIHDIGVQLKYDENFKIYREKGVSASGVSDYLFLYFHGNCCVELKGELVQVNPPAVVIFDIHSKQHYYAVDDTYEDDYVHFLFDDSRSFIDELNLPLNTLIPLPNNVTIPNLLRQMYEEFVSLNEYKKKSLEYLFRMILIKVSEMAERSKQSKIPNQYDELFQSLRSDIYLNPAKQWQVSECANENGLSISYFQKLYKSYFGHTFVQDVVRSRMEHAKHFLLATHYSVKEIAVMCGYHSETFFMKQFKQNEGVTPSQYRNQKIKKGLS